MRVAYADPPYVGQARKLYASEEVDHPALLAQLTSGEFDGWAVSLSTPSLAIYLAELERLGLRCIDGDYRVGAWVKPFAIFKPNVNPAYAWEPVIFRPARRRTREQLTARDWVSANITLKRGLCGAKPEAMCHWMFEVLGMEPGDELVDLFPGTGAVTVAWETWKSAKEASCANATSV